MSSSAGTLSSIGLRGACHFLDFFHLDCFEELDGLTFSLAGTPSVAFWLSGTRAFSVVTFYSTGSTATSFTDSWSTFFVSHGLFRFLFFLFQLRFGGNMSRINIHLGRSTRWCDRGGFLSRSFYLPLNLVTLLLFRSGGLSLQLSQRRWVCLLNFNFLINFIIRGCCSGMA